MFGVALFVPCATRPTVVFGYGTHTMQQGPARTSTDLHVMWYNNIIIIIIIMYEHRTTAAACGII